MPETIDFDTMMAGFDPETGDILFSYKALIVARMPKIINEKYPELAGKICTAFNRKK